MLLRTFPAGFIAPCLPTKTDKLPSGGLWIHEIKHDGFRLIARLALLRRGLFFSLRGVRWHWPRTEEGPREKQNFSTGGPSVPGVSGGVGGTPLTNISKGAQNRDALRPLFPSSCAPGIKQ